MPTRKQKNKNKTRKHNKTSKVSKSTMKRRILRSKKSTQKKVRFSAGGCGCGQKILGGSLYLSDVPQNAYYPYNSNLTNDPTSPANIGSARIMGDYSRTTGGGGGRGRRRRPRKIRGGSNFFSNLYTQLANSGAGMNYINSFGALNGGVNQSNLINGTMSNNSSHFSHPVSDQPYGHQNPPLV